MKEITLTIDKEDIYKEVSRTAEYTGSKNSNPDAYGNMATTDEDRDMLERFWNETKNLICDNVKKVMLDASETTIQDGKAFNLTLGLSDSFDDNLKDSMQSSLFSFFVTNIVSKWYTFTSKSEAVEYAAEAAGYVEDIRRKAFFKKKPVRPTF